MHLTPRSLGLAAAAAFTGCTLFGILTSIDLVPPATAGTPSAATATASAPAPLPTAATVPPTPLSTPAAVPAVTAPTPPSEPPAAATSSPLPRPAARSTSATTTTTAPGTRVPSRPRPSHRAATPTPGRRLVGHTPAPRPRPRPTARSTSVTGAWAAPVLRVGANSITTPRLTSGAKVSVTVGCSPSAGCAMTGSTLTIAPGTSVTVTWSAPARSTYTPWSVSRAL